MLTGMPWVLLPFILVGIVGAAWGVRRWREFR